MTLLAAYPYLAQSCMLLAMLGAGLCLLPGHRRAALAAAGLSVPFCLYEIVFIPEYWTPSMVVQRHVGFEDVLFSFATGGVAWIIPAMVARGTVALTWQPRTFLRRFVGGSSLGVASSLALWSLGLSIMNAVLLCIGVGIGVLAWRFPRHHILGLAGASGFGLLYCVVLIVISTIVPDFPAQWTAASHAGTKLGWIPAEEVFWACGFGAIWPRFIAYVFDARLISGAPPSALAAVGGVPDTHDERLPFLDVARLTSRPQPASRACSPSDMDAPATDYPTKLISLAGLTSPKILKTSLWCLMI